MSTPIKAKKTRRNQPVTFEETLSAAPVMPVAAAPAEKAGPRLSNRQFQGALVLVWMAAAVIGGIGVGRLILATKAPVSFEPPVPVAKATVVVAPAPATAAIVLSRPVFAADLAHAPATSPMQAQVGMPVSTLSLASIQGAKGPAGLQPGFNPTGFPQGNIGTSPVN
ncbi:MAG TPA: hypothetical protein VHQ86_05380 [Candidatus Saccharimonadia bacterium]|jgi:hypothetical protein|nr:hypothetical protein [Candidatus Saccharimonadia bacterium]